MTSISKLYQSLFLVFVLGLGAFAQTETGTISGTVTDPSGAVVSGAKVTITAVGTKAARTGTSDSNGRYAITNLQPGLYDVAIEGSGFAETKRQVQVTVGSKVILDSSLKVTGDTTIVEVVGSGGIQVETQRQEISEVVSSRQITELPTFNRNPYALVTTSGNVSDGNGSGSSGRGLGVNINGARSASTAITLDGADNVDNFTATLNQSVPLDSVQEFRIINSNFGAEYGRASGGVVNVATKSGTNSFHGTLYEFYRSSSLGANTVDNNAHTDPVTGAPDPIKKSRYVRNQFGFSFGGPVVKDKLFFFNGTEFIRVRSSATQQNWVPTPQFIAASAPETRAFFAAYGGGLVTAPTGRVLLRSDLVGGTNFNALPANTPILQQVIYSVPTDAGGGVPQNQHLINSKVDFNLSEKTTMYFRWAVQRADQFAGSVSFSPYDGYNTGGEVYGNNMVYNLTHIFTPRFVSQTKLVYNRSRNDQPLSTNPPGPTLYLAGAAREQGDLVAMPGYLPFSPGNAIPFVGPQNVYTINQDFNWSVGNHQFRFGGQGYHMRDNRTFGAFLNSVQELSTSSRAIGYENFLNGRLARFQGAVDPLGKFPCNRDANQVLIVNPACQVVTPLQPPSFTRNNRFTDYALYVQDSWRLRPRFTVNLGVRYEIFGVQGNADSKLDANFFYGSGSNFYDQIRAGGADLANNHGGLWASDYNNFAPRVGFAWDIFGDGKTSLRGGYGIAYERNFGNVTFNVLFNPPWYATLAISPGDVGGVLPIYTDNQGPLGGVAGVTKTLSGFQVRHVDEAIKTAYMHMWNGAVERQVGANSLVSVSYSGSKGVDLYSIENPNKPGSGVIYGGDVPTTTALATGRLNRQYTNLNTRRNNGMSDYHALNVGFRSNNLWNQGLQIQGNYTWAHTIDNLSSTFSDAGNNYNLGLLDPFNPALDRGNADFDIRHRFVMSAVWEMPYFKNSNNLFLKHGFGGWTFAPVFTAQTGNHFTIFDCNNGNQTCARIVPNGTFTSEDVHVGDNLQTYIKLPPATQFGSSLLAPFFGWPVSDFGLCNTPGAGRTAPCPWPDNMTRRNAFVTPGTWNIDLGIYKTFKVTESFGVQFRGELFNALNHSNLFVQTGSADNFTGVDATHPDGAILANRAGNRNIQLAVKLIF
ncbi:MAG TPA: TonB-dependent receptor [Terriglobales bacterium]|nr:TonB-dependent receptor [Terriglobales bacterium]